MKRECCHHCTPDTGRYPGCWDHCQSYKEESYKAEQLRVERTKQLKLDNDCKMTHYNAFKRNKLERKG